MSASNDKPWAERDGTPMDGRTGAGGPTTITPPSTLPPVTINVSGRPAASVSTITNALPDAGVANELWVGQQSSTPSKAGGLILLAPQRGKKTWVASRRLHRLCFADHTVGFRLFMSDKKPLAARLPQLELVCPINTRGSRSLAIQLQRPYDTVKPV